MNVEIMIPLKYLSNVSRIFEMSLINCEVKLILTWSTNCIIIYTDVADQIPTFTITRTKLYVPVVTLSTQDNAKLLPQLKSGFKSTIIWKKYLPKPEFLGQNPNLNHLVEPSFQGVNRFFVLAFENDRQRRSNKRYYLPNVEIKVMIDGKNVFDQPMKNNKITFENIRKIASGQGDDYTTGYLLDYNYYNYFILEEAKETVSSFSQGTVKVL